MSVSSLRTTSSPKGGPPTRPGAGRRTLSLLALLLTGVLLVAGCGSKSSTGSTGSGASGTTSGSSTGGSSGSTSASGSGVDANGCPTSNTKSFAKTKFVLHTGLAFGTFHRYIYKPFRTGGFSKGANGRILTFVKAGATALFDKREIRLAIEDVKANPTLCKTLAAPLRKLDATLTDAVSKAKSGDTSAVTDVNSQVASISSSSAKGGAPITERTDQSAG